MKSQRKTVVLAMALVSSSLLIMAGEQTERQQEPNKQAPLDLQADKIERKGAGVVVAEGHVVLKLGGWRIDSEKVVLQEEPSRAAAGENIKQKTAAQKDPAAANQKVVITMREGCEVIVPPAKAKTDQPASK